MGKRKRMRKSIVGTMHFGGIVDITDPCYGRDVWCRMNDVAIVPGDYQCVVWKSDEGEFGVRVGIIGIYLGGVVPQQNEMEHIGGIGVDAGLAGFFEHKPDYTDDQWGVFCDKIWRKDEYILENGFCAPSGYGDGVYDVFAYKNTDGKITALEIRCL